MEADYTAHVRKCHQCQGHGDLKHMPPMPLHTMTSPWPFSTWGIDIIGKIHTTASNGHEFILVAIDYFTKWVEATSYKGETEKLLQQFNIQHHKSSPYRPQTDGVVETANKNIGRILKRSTKNYKDWHLQFPYAL
ncbi:uncharacterized protein LOC126704033 [Quercus robur]|uniref:uncharacterized protein LOC126704033 n=1 Tax=Quercus robur TaxID=38942 RepID=UPI002163F0F3|nr:uncharacterized protein LOC126704033 [Quercus robur]